MNLVIISGSPKANSLSFRAALHLQQQLEKDGRHAVSLIDVREWQLPLFDKVFNSVETTPEAFRPLAATMLAADGFILVSPEYNGSYSSALKNLLDYFPKQPHKTFGIVAASSGSFGGMRSSQQMILLGAALFGIVSPSMLILPQVDKVFDEAGNITDQKFHHAVHQFLTEFIWLSEAVHAKRLLPVGE